MDPGKKRSRSNREADNLTHSEPGSSNSYPDPNNYLHVWDFLAAQPSSSNSYPDPNNYLHVWDFLAAGTPNSDQSHAAHNHDDSLGEVDTAHPKPVKKVRVTKELNDNMTEVRARAARHKGQMNFEAELTQALYAYGDDKEPLPETVRILDEIVTDFIIETCFTAAKSAEVCGRSKLKVDDFKFAIRRDPMLLGRVNELLAMDKHINTARKAFKTDEGREGLERGGRKKKGEGKDGEEKSEDKVEDKGVKVEKVEEELGDDLDDDME